jgi:hypothetical protein
MTRAVEIRPEFEGRAEQYAKVERIGGKSSRRNCDGEVVSRHPRGGTSSRNQASNDWRKQPLCSAAREQI